MLVLIRAERVSQPMGERHASANGGYDPHCIRNDHNLKGKAIDGKR